MLHKKMQTANGIVAEAARMALSTAVQLPVGLML